MRIGTNPLNKQKVNPLPSVVICVITHLPELTGYHEKRLEVVATSLTAARKNAGIEGAAFLVWDNGSCEKLRRWLKKFAPDFLILSPNVGKSTARTAIGRMFPPETILAIADDDIFYYPGWLEKQIKVLNYFPGVSLVTGYPVRTSFRWGNENTLKWAKHNAHTVNGRFIPEDWERDFCMSIGRDWEYHYQSSLKDTETKIKYKGMEVYATGHHCQFVTRAKFLQKFPQWDGEAMADEKPFDTAMDRMGLRLCTLDRLTRHIGNVIGPLTAEESQQYEVYSDGK